MTVLVTRNVSFKKTKKQERLHHLTNLSVFKVLGVDSNRPEKSLQSCFNYAWVILVK